MPRTDDLRIREMKELTPPSHLIREFACTEAAEQTAANARVALHRILHGQDDRLMRRFFFTPTFLNTWRTACPVPTICASAR